ncbi:hypothetical protein MLD38_003195 [Melastoma candidum]|uniref:Uncharacterized protein n=1 Tax=Melastoma candidum TaxID=119954 RepID=A0ACB9S3S3_9MYRT|nr:hypothetical protein MLD38_003195 [Melastoma candidum]
MDPLLDSPTPEISQGVSSFSERLKDKLNRSDFQTRCLKRALSMGQKDMVDFMELLLSPASNVLNKWFEVVNPFGCSQGNPGNRCCYGDNGRVSLLGIGSVNTPGSGYVLLHHVMGETDGVRGIWSYVEGGMGSVSMSICKSAQGAGADILTNAEVLL